MESARGRPPDDEDISGAGPNQVQRFRDALVADQRKRTARVKKGEKRDAPKLSQESAFKLLVLASRARPDGSLRGRRDGHDGWYTERQLAGFLCVGDRAFRYWWRAMKAAKWVRSDLSSDGDRAQRWLVVPGGNA